MFVRDKFWLYQGDLFSYMLFGYSNMESMFRDFETKHLGNNFDRELQSRTGGIRLLGCNSLKRYYDAEGIVSAAQSIFSAFLSL